jgi:chemotaxis response regulator CheB
MLGVNASRAPSGARVARKRCARPPARALTRVAASTTASAPSKAISKVVVIGAGWGGIGAAKSLCEAGADVTLVDVQDDPTGATPTLTKSGKPFEAGTRGAHRATATRPTRRSHTRERADD